MCEWSFNTIVPANFMLRHYDTADHILLVDHFRLQSSLLGHGFIRTFIQNYKFDIAVLTWSNRQIRPYLVLPVSDIYSFLFTKHNKNLLAKHYFVTSTI